MKYFGKFTIIVIYERHDFYTKGDIKCHLGDPEMTELNHGYLALRKMLDIVFDVYLQPRYFAGFHIMSKSTCILIINSHWHLEN